MPERGALQIVNQWGQGGSQSLGANWIMKYCNGSNGYHNEQEDDPIRDDRG